MGFLGFGCPIRLSSAGSGGRREGGWGAAGDERMLMGALLSSGGAVPQRWRRALRCRGLFSEYFLGNVRWRPPGVWGFRRRVSERLCLYSSTARGSRARVHGVWSPWCCCGFVGVFLRASRGEAVGAPASGRFRLPARFWILAVSVAARSSRRRPGSVGSRRYETVEV